MTLHINPLKVGSGEKRNILLQYKHVFALRGVRTFLWNCLGI